MKMAIILGVIHMSFGIILQVCNHKYFKKPISIWGEFVPQILFLWSIFGYLCFMVIYKWLAVTPNDYAPDLLKTLIYMFLSPGTLSGPPLFTGQVLKYALRLEVFNREKWKTVNIYYISFVLIFYFFILFSFLGRHSINIAFGCVYLRSMDAFNKTSLFAT